MVGNETLAMLMARTCMKVPRHRPTVASDRLAGLNPSVVRFAVEDMVALILACLHDFRLTDFRLTRKRPRGLFAPHYTSTNPRPPANSPSGTPTPGDHHRGACTISDPPPSTHPPDTPGPSNITTIKNPG